MPNSKHLEPRARLIKRTKAVDVDGPRSRDPHSQYEMISPQKASEYLKRNHCNRPLKKMTIARYARDMAAGAWKLTHQGIGFDRRGFLIDGQHRLMALVMANVTLRMMVTRDLPQDANEGLDGGQNRGLVDILHYKGIQATYLHVGMIKWMSYQVGQGLKTSRGTRAERAEYYMKYAEAISFTYSLFVVGKVMPRIRLSPVMAPFARAYYSFKDKKKLAKAAEIMITGLGGEEERWLILLRNYLLCLKAVSGETIRREIYLKTERALHGYLYDEPIGHLRPVNHELFPLPGEKIAEQSKESKKNGEEW